MNSTSRESIGRKKGIAITLYEIDGIKFGEFTLSSGKTSPYYVDLRVIPSHPNLFKKVKDLCTETIEDEIDIDNLKIAGVPTAGGPFAALISQDLRLPLLYIRKEQKSHGRKKTIEGKFSQDEVLLVDDVTTTGGSIVEAAEKIREKGGTVNHAVVILDRKEGAKKALQEEGIKLHSCYTITELIDQLKNSTKMDEEEYKTIMNHLEK